MRQSVRGANKHFSFFFLFSFFVVAFGLRTFRGREEMWVCPLVTGIMCQDICAP